jgi:ABC-type glycerol-3-phosphate transport system substrate-binding protein
MKRLLRSFHLLICLAVLLSACGANGFSFGPTPEPASITFSIPDGYKSYYTTQLANFHLREPGITVEIQSSNSYTTNPPDVSVSRWDDSFNRGGDRLAKGLDLTPFLEQGQEFDRSDYYPGLLDAFTRDGKLKGVPTGVDPFVILYNQDLFEKYSVPLPQPGWNWNDFKTSAMQLRDPVAGIYGYASTQGYVDSMFFVYQHGGSLISGSQTPQLDSPEAIEALDWYGGLFMTSDVAPTEEQARQDFNGEVQVGVAAGKVAMWMAPVSDIVGPNGKGWSFRIGVAPLPRDVIAFTVAQYEGLVISSQTKSPQASWKLVKYLTSQPLPWMVPARISLANSPAFAASIGKEQANGALTAMKDASLISTFDFRQLNAVIGIFTQATRAVVEGKATAAEALTVAQKSVPAQP